MCYPYRVNTIINYQKLVRQITKNTFTFHHWEKKRYTNGFLSNLYGNYIMSVFSMKYSIVRTVQIEQTFFQTRKS